VRGNEVADKDEDGHDHVLSDGHHVGAGDLGDGDAAVGLIGRVEVNMVRPNAGSDSKLEFLGLGQALSGQVAGVEGGGDDDLGVDELLVKDRVLALLAGGGDQGMALILEPLADAELVLSGSEKLRNLVVSVSPTYSKREPQMRCHVDLDHEDRAPQATPNPLFPSEM